MFDLFFFIFFSNLCYLVFTSVATRLRSPRNHFQQPGGAFFSVCVCVFVYVHTITPSGVISTDETMMITGPYKRILDTRKPSLSGIYKKDHTGAECAETHKHGNAL